MRHNVTLEYDLTNRDEAATYNLVLNIGNMDNAIRNFKKYLEFTKEGLKTGQEDLKKLTPAQLLDQVSDNFRNFFANNGLTLS